MPRNHASPRFRSGRPPRSHVAISASGRKTSGYVFAETASASSTYAVPSRRRTNASSAAAARNAGHGSNSSKIDWPSRSGVTPTVTRRDREAAPRCVHRRERRDEEDERAGAEHDHRPAPRVRVAPRQPADEEEQRLRERRVLVEEAAVRPQPRRHPVAVAVVLVDVAERPVRERPALREQRAHDEQQRAAGGDADRVARAPQRRSLFDSMSNHIANSVNCEPGDQQAARSSTTVPTLTAFPASR